ncbi:PIN domain-containing protein [Halorutilales archaeon Cl-col2-1]
MICLDNNLLSDYLDGKEEARKFLKEYESEPWAVSNIVVFEAYMGVVHGYIDGDVETIRQAIKSSMAILEVTERTVNEAVEIQKELRKKGHTLEKPDSLIVANAREHGGRFATAEKQFWNDDVKEVVDVVRYDDQ